MDGTHHLLSKTKTGTGTNVLCTLIGMQLNTKPYLIIMAAIVAIFVILGLMRNTGTGKLITDWGTRNQPYMKAIVLSVFLLFVAAAIPVLLKLFVISQHHIGNEKLPLVQLISRKPMMIVYTVWIVFAVGLAVALPVMLKDMNITNQHDS